MNNCQLPFRGSWLGLLNRTVYGSYGRRVARSMLGRRLEDPPCLAQCAAPRFADHCPLWICLGRRILHTTQRVARQWYAISSAENVSCRVKLQRANKRTSFDVVAVDRRHLSSPFPVSLLQHSASLPPARLSSCCSDFRRKCRAILPRWHC